MIFVYAHWEFVNDEKYALFLLENFGEYKHECMPLK